MRNAALLQVVFLRELLRLADWLKGFEDSLSANRHARLAMMSLFRESAYHQQTSQGPWERLYRLAWDYRVRDAQNGVVGRFETIAVTVPRPMEQHAREMVWAYWTVALISSEQNVTISEVMVIMDAITYYEFVPEDVFDGLGRMEEDGDAAQVIRRVSYRIGQDQFSSPHCAALAARFLDDEIEKTFTWLDKTLL